MTSSRQIGQRAGCSARGWTRPRTPGWRTLTLRFHITVEGDRLAFRPLGNGQRGCGVDRAAREREPPAGTNPPSAVCSPRRQCGALQMEGSCLTFEKRTCHVLKAESEPFPRYFLSRAGPAGTLLHTLRANSAQEELWNSGFQAPQRKAIWVALVLSRKCHCSV